jgi:hypothetical protein
MATVAEFAFHPFSDPLEKDRYVVGNYPAAPNAGAAPMAVDVFYENLRQGVDTPSLAVTQKSWRYGYPLRYVS